MRFTVGICSVHTVVCAYVVCETLLLFTRYVERGKEQERYVPRLCMYSMCNAKVSVPFCSYSVSILVTVLFTVLCAI